MTSKRQQAIDLGRSSLSRYFVKNKKPRVSVFSDEAKEKLQVKNKLLDKVISIKKAQVMLRKIRVKFSPSNFYPQPQ